MRRGQILEVDRVDRLTAAAPEATIVDFGDQSVLLPPLVNAHTHLELTHFPQWAAKSGITSTQEGFVEWIQHLIRVKRSIDFNLFRESIATGIKDSLASGTGAVGDILSWFPARDVYRDFPIYGRLYLETLGRDPIHSRRMLQTIGRISREVVSGRMRMGISPHSPYNLSSEFIEELFSYARRHGLPLSTHLAESAEETEFLLYSSGPIAEKLYPFVGWGDMLPVPAGRTPVAYLAARQGLVADNLLVHGIHVDERECEAIAKAKASVVLCPRSNTRLQVGTAPVEKYLDAGVTLALGTDSPASCESLSMWDELAFARSLFAGRVAPTQLLRMATCNGACALGLCSEMGSFSARMGAHFQVVQSSNLPAVGDLEDFLVSSGNQAEMVSLFLAGQDVFLGLDSR